MIRLGRDGWKKLVDELEASKLPHKEFAAQKGVALQTLQFWLYKFRRESRQESRPVILPVEMVASAPSEARRGQKPAPPTTVEAVLGSGVVLRIPTGVDVRFVRELLSALA